MQPTIELAKSSNTLNKLTFVLLYATDFADRLEKEIIPALKAGFVVLSDRYIFTALARAGVRGVDRQWLRNLYGFAIAPHMVFYLNIDVKTLIGRVLESRGMDFWESGMDLKHGDDIYDSFRAYQQRLLKEYASMGDEFHFRDARRAPLGRSHPGRAAQAGRRVPRAGREAARTRAHTDCIARPKPSARPRRAVSRRLRPDFFAVTASRRPDTRHGGDLGRRASRERLRADRSIRPGPLTPVRIVSPAGPIRSKCRCSRSTRVPPPGSRREADLDLARLRQIGLIPPLLRDLPRDHESVRRIPLEDLAPVAFGAVLLPRVAAAADLAFDDAARHRRLADVVTARPPARRSPW